ncbi:MAG: hypothetical protein L0215_04880 [Gemmataceae bacterium]|nr:hypothetical protein [Gemmataceae bacterium]
MGARRIRREQRQTDMKASRLRNGKVKTKERIRRDARIKSLLQKTKPPYHPVVLSWLSAKLGKPSARISELDIKQLLQSHG